MKNRIQVIKPRDYIWVIYYLVLIVVMLWGAARDSTPNTVSKMVFMAAILLPVLQHPHYLSPALTCFLLISRMGFSDSFMPSSLSIITLAVFVAFIFVYQRVKDHVLVPWPVVVLALFVSFVDAINNYRLEQVSFCLALILLFCYSTKKNEASISMMLRLSIVVSAVSLCLLFFLYKDRFTFDYGGSDSSLERTAWMGANYFGSAIGIAAICSLYVVLFESGVNKIKRLIYAGALILFAIVLLYVASRGAALSLGICVVLMFFSNRIKNGQKILIGIIISGVIYLLYKYHYFDLLMYRIEMDEGGGSGRIEIWTNKFNVFFQEGNILHWLFGIGFRNANYLGYSKSSYLCVHNDMLNFLFAYGLVGLILFFALLWLPIRNAFKHNNNKSQVLIGIIYLFVCGLTLQPLCEGYVVYYCFYFYLWYLSQSNVLQLEKHF